MVWLWELQHQHLYFHIQLQGTKTAAEACGLRWPPSCEVHLYSSTLPLFHFKLLFFFMIFFCRLRQVQTPEEDMRQIELSGRIVFHLFVTIVTWIGNRKLSVKTWQKRIRTLLRQNWREGLWDVSRDTMAPDTLNAVRVNIVRVRPLLPSAGWLTALMLQAR